jgi:phosphoglycolate phosphatase-like HAD superfamily hydrolase
MVGDKDSDIEFGHRAGAGTILISFELPDVSKGVAPSLIVQNLLEAARFMTGPTGAFV